MLCSFKVVIPLELARVVNLLGVRPHLPTNSRSTCPTQEEESSAWPTRGPTPTSRNCKNLFNLYTSRDPNTKQLPFSNILSCLIMMCLVFQQKNLKRVKKFDVLGFSSFSVWFWDTFLNKTELETSLVLKCFSI